MFDSKAYSLFSVKYDLLSKNEHLLFELLRCEMLCVCVCIPGERMDTHSQVVDRLRSVFHSGVTIPEQFRRTQLTKLMSMIKENEEQILNALHKDLTKVQRQYTHYFLST